MSYFSIDVETDGPAPGLYSMVSIGAVVLNEDEDKFPFTFYSEIAPISNNFDSHALAVGGFTREQSLTFPKAEIVIPQFANWVTSSSTGKARFVSDNAGFDWMFVCWYLYMFYGQNPFGYSSFSLTSFWKGYDRNMRSSFKHLRNTKHSHNALDDAMGNAEALQKMLRMMNDGY